ncbi:MAG TPA: hypothetical protein VFF73_30560, partial [Planctomycetota bacterium]|nr:hypothetical protein [Planctomycetota bacterium]
MITRDQRPMTLAEIEAIGRIERSWERTTGYLAAGLVLSLLSSCVPVLVLTDGFAWIFTPGDIAARVAVTVALIGFAAVVAAAWLNSGHAFGLATD